VRTLTPFVPGDIVRVDKLRVLVLATPREIWPSFIGIVIETDLTWSAYKRGEARRDWLSNAFRKEST
jgi:hypothetical protein